MDRKLQEQFTRVGCPVADLAKLINRSPRDIQNLLDRGMGSAELKVAVIEALNKLETTQAECLGNKSSANGSDPDATGQDALSYAHAILDDLLANMSEGEKAECLERQLGPAISGICVRAIGDKEVDQVIIMRSIIQRVREHAPRFLTKAELTKMVKDRWKEAEQHVAYQRVARNRLTDEEKAAEAERREAERVAEQAAQLVACAKVAAPLIECEDVFGALHLTMEELGVVGEHEVSELALICGTSRILDKPMNAVIKGESSSGKSYVSGTVVTLFPPEKCDHLTSFSPKSLVYHPDDDHYVHGFLSLAEASPLRQNGVGEENERVAMLREFLSSGRLVHQTVEKSLETGQFETRTKVKEGPCAFLCTTTQTVIDAEMDTRLTTLRTDETGEQTWRIMEGDGPDNPEFEVRLTYSIEVWHAYQRWLALSPNKAVIPYRREIVWCMKETTERPAVRFRRDFNSLKTAIRVSVLMHQEHRERNKRGFVIANLQDYENARRIIAPTMDETVGAVVSDQVGDLVKHVKDQVHSDVSSPHVVWTKDGNDKSVQALATTSNLLGRVLGLSKTTAYRRVRDAVGAGLLANLATRSGQGLLLSPVDKGDSQPKAVLPTLEELAEILAENQSKNKTKGCGDD